MKQLSEDVAEIQLSYRPKKKPNPTIISSSQSAFEEILKWIPEDTIALKEYFVVMYLNRANEIIGVFNASSGGITSTIADPRLIITVALKSAAVGMILAHNHPSGNVRPSEADKYMTSNLKGIADLLDIKLVDHLIVSEISYYSFAENGLI
jgi:DNA repair protein RadC